MTQQKGFSPIEILVTLAVLVILVGGVWVWQNNKTTTSLCSSLEVPGYELAGESFNNVGVEQSAELLADLRGDGHKNLVRIYVEKTTDWTPRSNPVILKVFSGTGNCYQEEFSFDGMAEKRNGNEVGKIELLSNFWNDSKDVVAVETISTGYGSGFILFLNFVTFEDGKYQVIPGPTLGELSTYKYTGTQGKGSEILVAKGIWGPDESHFADHRQQLITYAWNGQRYNQRNLGVTQGKYSGDIDAILEREPSVLEATESTTDWKTYENKQYSYAIKYPEGFAVENTTASLKQLHQKDKVQRILLLRESFAKDKIRIDVSVYENTHGANILSWLNEGSWSLAKSATAVQGADLESILLGGKAGVKGYQMGLAGVTLTVVVAGPRERNDYMYVFELEPQSCYGYTESDIRDLEGCNLFNQILSTFKFLD